MASAALIGKAGELLVAAELMRRGVEVAFPASDVGVDALAYRLSMGQTVPTRLVPVQVKSRATTGYNFRRVWFTKAPGVVLVQVWNIATVPEFYVFDSLDRVEEALGPTHAASPSWQQDGGYSVTGPGLEVIKRMQAHRDRWERIIDRLA